ncbi:hypothetical protein GOODEAATRI_012629, partial [Goodea atripinnis]
MVNLLFITLHPLYLGSKSRSSVSVWFVSAWVRTLSHRLMKLLCIFVVFFVFFCYSLQMLSTHVPTLVSYLSEHALTEALLGALVDVSQASPSSLVSFLPALRMVGQQSTAFLSHVAKIHGAVGILSE